MKILKFLPLFVLLFVGILEAKEEVVVWSISEYRPTLEKVVKKFEKQNPDIDIVMEYRSTDEHKNSTKLAIGGGVAPDAMFMWSGLGFGGEIVNSGGSANLDKYYKQYKWDERFLGASTAMTKEFIKNERHGVPFMMHGMTFYFNKALFKKAGISSAPTTYKELINANEKLLKIGIKPFTVGGSVNWHLTRLVDYLFELKCGPKKHNQLTSKKIRWDSEPCVTDAYKELKVWSDRYILKPFMSIDSNQATKLFVVQRAAMMLEGDWFYTMVKKISPKFVEKMDFFLLPTKWHRTYTFGEYYYVYKNSKNKDGVVKFLDFLSSKKIQQSILGSSAAISVNKSVDYSKSNKHDKKWLKIFENYKETFLVSDQALSSKDTSEYFRVHNLVASGKMKPEDGGKEMQKFFDLYK